MKCSIPQATYDPPTDYRCTSCELLGHIVSEDGLTITLFFKCDCPTIPQPHASVPLWS
jgi:hypothetical protein